MGRRDAWGYYYNCIKEPILQRGEAKLQKKKNKRRKTRLVGRNEGGRGVILLGDWVERERVSE